MKGKLLAGACALCMVVVATSCTGESTPSDPALHPTASENQGRRAHPRTAAPQQQLNRRAEQDYLCIPERCRASGRLQARSLNEARWLIENGYPSEDESKRLSLLNTAQLGIEADAGNRAAQVLYGKRIAVESNFLSGLTILRQAAQAGSLYAYYGISDAYLEGSSADPINSYAYLRLAYILGDSKAAGELAGRDLSSIERAVADERASSLYRTFAEERAPSVRPLE
ncbi:hypothetical protein [Stenotrophomonas sp. BIGb0135]|uniref:hypothetical protein n=1 Tax=Stenotrophomonas sp. BIGb0135 TaxID=2940620 RepID=UPI002169229B|nr:hypothetical protein [Stenotrophomonas sp. BIGb0135]MCS4236216.1 TPR repeat protein [Stenotrophomonas sp. BIGb0135]